MASDDFNGADVNPLPSPWGTGTGWGNLRRLSNQCANAAGSDTDAMMRYTTSSALKSYAEYRSGVTDGGTGFMDANGNAYVITAYDTTIMHLFRVDGGPPNYAELGSGVAQTAWVAGDIIGIEFQGNDVVAFINAVEIMRRTDATYRTNMKPAIFSFAGDLRFDNWTDGVNAIPLIVFDRTFTRYNRPGRGPYSRGIYRRPAIVPFDLPVPPPPPPVVIDYNFDRTMTRDNRPGRGPYSIGRFFRPRLDAMRFGTVTVQVGLVTETDSALPMTASKVRSIGLNTETDTAFAIARSKLRALDLTTEADSAFSIAHTKVRELGLTIEVDNALPMGRNKLQVIGIPSETDTALAMTHTKVRELGLTIEVDNALPITSQGQIIVAVGTANETDTALAMTHAKLRALGLTTESDSAFALARMKRKVLGLPTETDTALGMTARRIKTVVMGLAVETDQAFSLLRSKGKSLGLAIETDTALPFDVPQVLEPNGPNVFERPDGEPATLNPLVNAIGTGGLHFRSAGTVGVVLARFGWADMAAGTITTALQPGAALPVFVPQIYGAVGGRHALFIRSGLKWLRPGYQVTVFVQGDFWTRFAAGARRGDQVYAGIVDGAPVSGYAPNALPTPFYVVQNARPGELSIISTWETF